MKFLCLLIAFLSFEAFAGYQCDLSLTDSSDTNKIIASKKVEASPKDLRSEMIENFFVTGKQSLSVKVFIDGWLGEEEMSAVVLKKENDSEKFEPVSEKVSLRGDDRGSVWFDSYKLKVNCSLS